ncbi:Gfo/Idh/MocA family protein [Pontibacillus sp. HMF3514]|uniref:Gfo/Idh/MocA family protein n=1 Tax=Pontibacillus sp. HMF3514 TaxID=2692425 RepID=UPI0013204E63|nr:Gfo/Idh/MocA family oxidoreductase [Pontibacillus sp. HMF3514]QHE53036.1 Gfo/Idh/MocA family oxidoreductase [Pontibacillus sp. HMF3514]
MNKLITAIIVGAGHRSLIYASYALQHPQDFKIVGVVEPDDKRRSNAAAEHDIPEEHCFKGIEELLAKENPIADAVINGTMDDIHIKTSLPILRAGYDLLLEKPIGTNEKQLNRLLNTAKKYGRKVMVCHVLRHSPFYSNIKKRVANDEIGDIISIQTEENVSYHHMAVSYVRGKWNSLKNCHSTMLMAKSCHDLDIITWMKGGVAPVKVSSFGSLMHFRPEKAPHGAGKRCLVDCEIESTCPYSSKKNYIEQGLWSFYAWKSIEHISNPTVEQKLESLRTDNPYGRCVWHCDNDVVDHQSVLIEFEDGSTATHSMVGGASKPCRTIHLIGTKGEIYGVMEDGYYLLRRPNAKKGHEYIEERIVVDVVKDSHGGGDLLLVEDFVKVLQGRKPSLSTTTLEDSIYGHLIGFRADQARLEQSTKTIEPLSVFS